MLTLRALVFSALSVALILTINIALKYWFSFSITDFIVLIVPAGAIILGFVASIGLGFAPHLRQGGGIVKALILYPLVVGFIAIFLDYYIVFQILQSGAAIEQDVNFADYMIETFRGMQIGQLGPGEGGLDVGDWGLFLGGLDFVGAPIGGVAGALATYDWRVRRSKLRSIPLWVDDISGLIACMTLADGHVDEAELFAGELYLSSIMTAHFRENATKTDEQQAWQLAHTHIAAAIEKMQTRDGALPEMQNLKRAEYHERLKALECISFVGISDGQYVPEEDQFLLAVTVELGLSEVDATRAHRSAQDIMSDLLHNSNDREAPAQLED